MIYNYSDEAHFQVMSSSFSVSPTVSGYTLMFSANGLDYSPFTTVAPGQNKQFVNMSNGNYYYLSGNTGDFEVNWERECHGGGGGGTAGVSSIDGETGALTTKTINGNAILGSGDIVISGETGSQVSYSQTLSAGTEIGQITIDGSATTIYAPQGGSSEQNYVIVDALSDVTEPHQGMEAFVRSGNTIDAYSAYTFSIEGLSGDGAIGYSNNYTTNFRFDGQGGVKCRDEARGYQYFDLTSEYQYFDNRVYAKVADGSVICTYAPEANYQENTGVLASVSLTDVTAEIPVPFNGSLYRYENGEWLIQDAIYLSDYGMDNAERAAVYAKLAAYKTAFASNSEILSKIYSFIRFRIFPVLSFDVSPGYDAQFSYIENQVTLVVATLSSNGNLVKSYHSLTTIPTASANTVGGIKVGSGLTIDSNGVLSAKVVALSQAEYDALVQAGTVDANTLYVII